MKSYVQYSICGLLCLIGVSVVICDPIKPKEDINQMLTEIISDKISSKSLEITKGLLGEMEAVQFGEMAMPPNDLVISLGMARYLQKSKLVSVKEFQEGQKKVREFVQEVKPLDRAVFDTLSELDPFLKAYTEAEANELSKKWFVYGSYLKLYGFANSRIIANAFNVFTTLPYE